MKKVLKPSPLIEKRAFFLAPLMLASGALPTSWLFARSPMTQSSLKHDLSTFVGFGEHRVGTPGEVATVKWLEQRLKAAGYTTTIDDFSVKTLLNPGGLLSAFDQ